MNFYQNIVHSCFCLFPVSVFSMSDLVSLNIGDITSILLCQNEKLHNITTRVAAVYCFKGTPGYEK